MIDNLTQDDLRKLARIEDPAAVTLLMPTFESGREVRQNAVRFKNLVTRIHDELKRSGMTPDEIEVRLCDARSLIDDNTWWQHQGRGLAWFSSREGCVRFRLPVEVEEQGILAEHFYLRPLIQVPQQNGNFFLLAVSQNRVRLFRGNRFEMELLDPDKMPSDLRSALNIDEYVESLQQHSTAPRSVSGGMMFHGHGGAGMDVQKQDEILPFFRRIDEAFCSHFGNQKLPLLFAGVDFLFPLYREASDYHWLIDRPIEGNTDESTPSKLQQLALEALAPTFARAVNEALESYHDGIGKLNAGHDASTILTAARDGLVETLLLSDADRCWGIRTDGTDGFELSEENTDGSLDLGNEATIYTLRTGGRVLMCDTERMPDRVSMAAVFRAPIPV